MPNAWTALSALTAVTALTASCAQHTAAPRAVVPQSSAIQVCVVDTIVPGGMMTISATVAGADTTVLTEKGRVPIMASVAGPKTLQEATWINAKTPLQLATSGGRVRFAPSGAAHTYAPGRVMLLGVMRGLPLFALGSEAAGMRPEVESLAAKGVDLEKALQQNARLRTQAARIRSLYVPTSLVGCELQPFSRLKR
jgi:hypothetical protein